MLAIPDLLGLPSPYPAVGYNFCLVMDDKMIGFRSINGLTLKKNSFVPFHEGGENLSVKAHIEEKKDLNRLTLTKGVGFFNPAKLKSKIYTMILLVYGSDRLVDHAYAFSTGYVESVSVSDFNAEESRALIDTTVIAYDYAVELELPWQRSGEEMYRAEKQRRMADQAARVLSDSVTASKIASHNKKVRSKESEKAATLAKSAPPIEY